LVNGDTSAVFTGGLSRAGGENVGAYAIGQGTLSAGSNYGISYVGANLTIVAAGSGGGNSPPTSLPASYAALNANLGRGTDPDNDVSDDASTDAPDTRVSFRPGLPWVWGIK
jgi:hypothetical protein